MLELANNKLQLSNNKFRNEILSEYYANYFDQLTSEELDREFNRNLITLAKVLNKLPKENRNSILNTMTQLVEVYIENKIDKSLSNSLSNILKFL